MRAYLEWQKRRVSSRRRGIEIVLFPVLFILLFVIGPGWWASRRFPWPMGLEAPYVGVLLFALGAALYLWTIVLFAKARGTQVPVAPTQRLVTTGPYAVSRNPMVTSAMIMVCGAGVAWDSWSFVVAGLLMPSVYLVYIKLIEEKELEARFGEEYLAYKRSTPFLLPRLPRRRARGAAKR